LFTNGNTHTTVGTDLERGFEEWMHKNGLVGAINDKRVKMRAKWSAGAD